MACRSPDRFGPSSISTSALSSSRSSGFRSTIVSATPCRWWIFQSPFSADSALGFFQRTVVLINPGSLARFLPVPVVIGFPVSLRLRVRRCVAVLACLAQVFGGSFDGDPFGEVDHFGCHSSVLGENRQPDSDCYGQSLVSIQPVSSFASAPPVF